MPEPVCLKPSPSVTNVRSTLEYPPLDLVELTPCQNGVQIGDSRKTITIPEVKRGRSKQRLSCPKDPKTKVNLWMSGLQVDQKRIRKPQGEQVDSLWATEKSNQLYRQVQNDNIPRLEE